MEELDITFIHPTDSAHTFRADVSGDQTADQCIEQLASHDFFDRQAGRVYRLSYDEGDAESRELKGSETLASAGVKSGAALAINASTQGAEKDYRRD